MFTYQGKTYTKSGPLTASLEGDGRNKLIPRSADVQATDKNFEDITSSSEEVNLNKDRVIQHFTQFHDYCIAEISALTEESNENILDDLKNKIGKAYQESISSLLKDE